MAGDIEDTGPEPIELLPSASGTEHLGGRVQTRR